MTRRVAGPHESTRTRAPYVLPIGHLSTKSSVYSPVSMSRMSQDLVYNHMKSHYQRISSAKACVDTKAPKSMKLTIKEKDRRRKETLLASSIQRTSSRPSSRQTNFHTEASNSPREREINNPTLNHNSINGNGQPSLRQRPKNGDRPRSSESSRSRGKFSESYRENGKLQQHHYSRRLNDTDNFRGNNDTVRHNIHIDENNYERFQRTRHRTDQQPNTDDSMGIERNNEAEPNIPDRTSLIHASSQRNGENWRNETLGNGFKDNEYGTSRICTSTPRLERQDDFEMNPNLMTFSYKTPPTRRQKKSTEKVIWTQEQKYLQFISDVTSDVLARGICSNRVINKVFESHIEKRKDDLDEENMREMINQLKEDLGVTDD